MDPLARRLDELAAARPIRAAAGRHPHPAPAHDLAAALEGREYPTPAGTCWYLETPFEQACARQGLPLPSRVAEQGRRRTFPLSDLDPRRSLVIDIETGGFAGTPVFLIGCVPLGVRPWRVVQWLTRDYPEEAAILAALAGLARDCDTWITFNGKSFDEPFLRDRAAVHRVSLPTPHTHVDLLHHARWRWGGELPNCKLQTLERHLLGWQRVGDVPGQDIPDLFHHCIRTRRVASLRPVLEHNQLDLISCTELLLRTAD